MVGWLRRLCGGGVEQNWKYSSAQLGLELGNFFQFPLRNFNSNVRKVHTFL